MAKPPIEVEGPFPRTVNGWLRLARATAIVAGLSFIVGAVLRAKGVL